MSDTPYQIKLENVFEGPMDLLVHLIKKHEVDIYDIPIAMITDQYLAYLDWMKSLNIDFAGNFLLMAATLTQIKSRLLLPVHDDGDEDDDPRLEIAKPLAEYLQMKSAAEELASRDLLGDATFVRKPSKDDFDMPDDGEFIQVGLFELIDAFKRILEKIPASHKIDFGADRISVRERISEIVDILETKGSIVFEELFDENVEKSDIIVTFLSILEMVKLELIRVIQHVQSSVIRIFYL